MALLGLLGGGGALTSVASQEADAATTSAAPPPSLFTPQLLQNPSFESQFSYWSTSAGQAVAVYGNGAPEGGHYLETNTGTAGAGGAVYQTVATTPVAGHGYEAWVSLRSPTGAAVHVGVALLAVGGASATEAQTTSVTVSHESWTRVPVHLDVGSSGHTGLEFLVSLSTTGANLDLDAAGLQDAGLLNSSFEQGFTHWQASGARTAVYGGSAAEDGHYLELNQAAPGGAVYQDLATTPVAGHSYRAEMLLRSPSARAVTVSLSLAARDGPSPKQAASTTVVLSSSTWILYSVDLDVAASGHDDLRVRIAPSPGVNVDVDAVSLADAGVVNASFENQANSWTFSPGENGAVYSTRAAENRRFLETNAPSSGGDVYQDVPAAVVAGDSYRAQVALRSPANAPVKVIVALWAMGGSGPVEGGFTYVKITKSGWSRVSSDLDVTEAGHTTLRMQVFVETTGVNLDLDAAQVTQAPGPGGLDALRSAIVATAVGQDQYHAAVAANPAGSDCNVYSTYWNTGSPCGNGLLGQSWCASFAAWVWRQAGVSFTWGYQSNDLNALSYSFVSWGQAYGTLKPGATNDPVPGDAVVWGDTSTGYGQHVGIVTGVANGQIDVVSGDWANAVNDQGWFNPSTSEVEGYPIVGYVSPEPLSSANALPANSSMMAPALAPAAQPQPSAGIAPLPKMSVAERNREIARQKAP